MKINTFNSILAGALFASALFACGCVSTVDGRSKFAFPFTADDTIPSRYERSVEQVAKATRWVLEHDGKLILDNAVNNTFEAKINERTVYVRVTKVDDKVSQLEIQARTSVGSDLKLDAQLDKEIALRMTVSP